MAHIRRALVADAVTLAPRLREADRNECRAFLGIEPEGVLPLNVNTAEKAWCFVGDNGEPVGMFGVSPVDQHPYFGIVWMVTTPEITDYRRELIRLAPIWLDRMHSLYPLLGNHVDARNTLHVRWLRRMGFSFLRTLPTFGVERRPFHEFARLRHPDECA